MRLYEAINQEIGSQEAKLTKNEAAALRTIARMGWGTFTIRMLQEATDLSYSRARWILQGYTAKGTVYAGLLEKCPALAVVDVTVTDNSTEETVCRHELLFQFDAGRYREWTAGLSVWLEEGCKEIGPGKEAVFPGCDLRSFATPPPAEGVPGVGIPGLQCSPAPRGAFGGGAGAISAAARERPTGRGRRGRRSARGAMQYPRGVAGPSPGYCFADPGDVSPAVPGYALPGAAVLTVERPRALWWGGALFFSGRGGFLCSMMLRLSGAALFRPLLDTKFRHGGASSRGWIVVCPLRGWKRWNRTRWYRPRYGISRRYDDIVRAGPVATFFAAGRFYAGELK